MSTNPNCGQPIARPYLEYEGTAGLGAPLPISSLPKAKFPLTGSEIMIFNQAGLTVQAPLSSVLTNLAVSIDTVTTGTLALPSGSAYLRVVNGGGGPLTIVPPAVPTEGQTVSLIDWGQNADTFNWTFQGTLKGVVNPIINQYAGGLVVLIWSAQGGWGTSP